jgi:hypothetical protein
MFHYLSTLIFLFGVMGISHAETPASTLSNLVTNGDKGSEVQLEVRQMPLAKVLDAVTKQTKVPIHYSVLPEGLITATCVGTALKPVLECLLNHKADLIVRYPKNSGKTEGNQIIEAWVLGSKIEVANNTSSCAVSSDTGSMALTGTEFNSENNADQSNEILKLTKSKDADERADAVGTLIAAGRDGDPAIKAALEEALHDQDANVRAQAISTLTHRGDTKDESASAIQEALQDSSTDVRLMAVDGIGDDIALLQQAVNDSDEAVRVTAELKLAELTQRKNTTKDNEPR